MNKSRQRKTKKYIKLMQNSQKQTKRWLSQRARTSSGLFLHSHVTNMIVSMDVIRGTGGGWEIKGPGT